jgi:hypothetical protein
MDLETSLPIQKNPIHDSGRDFLGRNQLACMEKEDFDISTKRLLEPIE